jgi:hypothetical protein
MNAEKLRTRMLDWKKLGRSLYLDFQATTPMVREQGGGNADTRR